MANKLYLGNLSFRVGEEEIKNLLGQHGNVQSVKLITDRETGRSKGFAFAEMGSAEEAESVIQNLDQKEFEGRNLRVSIARERERR